MEFRHSCITCIAAFTDRDRLFKCDRNISDKLVSHEGGLHSIRRIPNVWRKPFKKIHQKYWGN